MSNKNSKHHNVNFESVYVPVLIVNLYSQLCFKIENTFDKRRHIYENMILPTVDDFIWLNSSSVMVLWIKSYWGQYERRCYSKLTLMGRYLEDGGQECHCFLLMSPIIFDYQLYLSNKDSCSSPAHSPCRVSNFLYFFHVNVYYTKQYHRQFFSSYIT